MPPPVSDDSGPAISGADLAASEGRVAQVWPEGGPRAGHSSDLEQAHSAVASAAARLKSAEADFDSALDREARMPELRQFDAEVAVAELELGAARGVVEQVLRTTDTADGDHRGT